MSVFVKQLVNEVNLEQYSSLLDVIYTYHMLFICSKLRFIFL